MKLKHRLFVNGNVYLPNTELSKHDAETLKKSGTKYHEVKVAKKKKETKKD